MQRPLYMQPKDALEYGIIDGIVKSQKKKDGDQIIDHVPRLEEYGRDVSGVVLPGFTCAATHVPPNKLQESCRCDMTFFRFGHEQWGAQNMCFRVDRQAESRVGGRLLILCLLRVFHFVV